MSDVVVVGSEGYLGKYIVPHISTVFGDPIKLDAALGHDVTACPPELLADKTVVYLASFHETTDDTPETAAKYNKLMIDGATHVADHARKLIYISTMRAITDRQRLYGRTKNLAERELCRYTNTHIIRIGTLWGGFGSATTPTRATAINYAIAENKFEGDHWMSFTTHIDAAWKAIYARLLDLAPDRFTSRTDTFCMLHASDVRALLAGTFYDAKVQTRFNIERVKHVSAD